MRSRLVAEMSRASTLTGFLAPTGLTSPSWIARSSLTCAARGSSPTSSRNSVPPLASTNLPVWRSVAPVKAPFSWPNRIDSTRLSGMAPQLTATKGLARRSPEPWMARAISSLPTPDWPATSPGIADAAAFAAGVGRVAQRPREPLGADRLDHEIGGARAHRGDHVVDAAVRGLHDHRDGK